MVQGAVLVGIVLRFLGELGRLGGIGKALGAQ